MAIRQELGELYWKITGDNSNVNKKLDQTEKKAKGFGDKLNGAFRAIQFAVVAAGITKITKELITAASDAEESQNAVNVTFREASRIIQDYAKTASDTVGLSSTKFKELSTVIGAQLKQSGFSIDMVAKQTVQLTERAADLASVFNVEVTEATTALGSALRGEAEPARRFGVNISDAAVQAEALALGLVRSKKEITDQIKVQARLSLIYKQSADVAGDFKNTSDGLANSSRILSSRVIDLAAKYGRVFLPLAEDVVTGLNDLISGETDLEKITDDLIKTQGEYKKILSELEGEQSNLNDAEKRSLEIRKILLERNILKLLDATNKAYKDQVSEVDESAKKAELYSKRLRALEANIKNNVEEGRKYITINREQANLLGITSARLLSFISGQDTAGTTIVKTSTILKKYNSALERNKGIIQESIEANESLEIPIKRIAQAYLDGEVSQKSLDALLPGLRNKILLQAKALEKLASSAGDAGDATDLSSKVVLSAYDKLLDKQQKFIEENENLLNGLVSAFEITAEGLGAISELSSAISDRNIEDIERQRDAALESAGVREESEIERIENELAAAREARDEELVAEKEKELARAKINEEFDKKVAKAEYNGALVSWGLQLGQATAKAAGAILTAANTATPYEWAGTIPFATAIGALNVATVAAQKPKAPSFDEGTMGVRRDILANVHKDEIILPPNISKEAKEQGVSIQPAGSGRGGDIVFQTAAKEELYRVQYDDAKNGVYVLPDVVLVKV